MPPAEDDDLPVAEPVSPNPKPERPDEPVPGEPVPAEAAIDRPAARDPILDDPFFADPVAPAPTPPLENPLLGEPVLGDIVLDDPVPVVPVVPPTPDADALPEAVPVRQRPQPPRATLVPAPPRRQDTQPPRHEHSAAARAEVEADPPGRPRVFAACAVIGCLGLLMLGAVGFLVFATVVILGQFGDRFGNPFDDPPPPQTSRARPGPVTATKLREAIKSIDLPRVDAVGRGAGGRYLVLRTRQTGTPTLHVFDPVEAAMLRSFAFPGEPNVLFACGAAKLFVYRPNAKTIERYDLLTWEMEKSEPWRPGRLDALVIGPAADAPLLAVTDSENAAAVDLVDPDTLTAERGAGRTVPGLTADRPLRPSADGLLLGVGGRGGFAMRYRPGTGFPTAPLGEADNLSGPIVPSPDGRYIYTQKGVYQADGAASWQRITDPRKDYFYTFPTAHGSGLFLSVDVEADGRLRGPLKLHLAGSGLPAGQLDKVKLPDLSANDTRLPADQRIHVWPAAGLVAVLVTEDDRSDRLDLDRVDLAAALRQGSPNDYLVIASDPPTTAVRGQKWSYTPTVWTRAGRNYTVKIEGLPGASPDPEQKEVTWNVPTDYPQNEVEVTVKVTERPAGKLASPREAVQKFRLVVTDKAATR